MQGHAEQRARAIAKLVVRLVIDRVGLRGRIDPAGWPDCSTRPTTPRSSATRSSPPLRPGRAGRSACGSAGPRERCSPDRSGTVAWPPRPSAPAAARSRATHATAGRWPGSFPGGGCGRLAAAGSRTRASASRTIGKSISEVATVSAAGAVDQCRARASACAPRGASGPAAQLPCAGRPHDRRSRPASRRATCAARQIAPEHSSGRYPPQPPRRSRHSTRQRAPGNAVESHGPTSAALLADANRSSASCIDRFEPALEVSGGWRWPPGFTGVMVPSS